MANPITGAARVAWMEFWTHLRSPRLIVLAALLGLVVLGASYGLSRPVQAPFNQTQVFAHPAIVNESGTIHYVAIAFFADIYGTPAVRQGVSLYELSFSVNGTLERLVGQASTNDTGFVSFDLGTTEQTDKGYDFRLGSQSTGSLLFFSPDLANQTFTSIFGRSAFSTPFGSQDVAYLHILALDGTPATGADIYLNDTLLGHPGSNGYFRLDVPPGDHTIRVVFRGVEETYPVSGFQSGATFENGADAVLLALSFTVMPLLLPIVAIAVSFDTVARERSQGSLELLLCRRIRREGIVLGKFLGAFISIALPVVGTLLAGIGIVSLASGRAPTPTFAAAILLSSLFLVAVYALLMLVFSTLAKSVGTAVVFGVVVWIVFNVLFGFLAFLALFSVGGDPTSQGFYQTLAIIFLSDPNLIYQMLVAAAVPSSGQGSFGLVPVGVLSPAAIAVAAVMWIAGLLLLAMILFRRKAEA